MSLSRCVLAFGLFSIFTFASKPAIAQQWEPTNGPYAECASGVIADPSGHAFINSCTSLLYSGAKLDSFRVLARNVDDLSALSDGSMPLGRFGTRLFDTSRYIIGAPTNNSGYSATWTSAHSILIAIDGIGVIRTKNNGLLYDTVNSGLQDLKVRWLRADAAGTVYLATASGMIYASPPDGIHWTELFDLHGAVTYMTVSPTGALYLAQGDTLWRSNDHGASHQTIALPVGSGKVIAMAFSGSRMLCVTSLMGILSSTDDGASWQAINEGLDSLDVSGAAFPGNGGALIATTYHGGLYRADSLAALWRSVPMHQIPSDYQKFSRPYDARLYVATQTHGVYRTDDKGDHWTRTLYSFTDTVNDIASHGPNLVVAMRHGLAHSADGGDSFDTSLSWPGHENVAEVVVDKNGYFYALAGTTIYEFDQACFRSEDGGRTWSEIPLPSGAEASSLQVDSTNQLVLMEDRPFLRTFEPEIWVSKDLGTSWTKTETPYFVQNWEGFAAAPDGDFYLYTQYGLFQSEGATYDKWTEIGNSNDPYVDMPWAFVTGDNYFSSDRRGNLIETWDHGATWQTVVAMPYPSRFVALAFNNTVFTAGTILTTQQSGVFRLSGTSSVHPEADATVASYPLSIALDDGGHSSVVFQSDRSTHLRLAVVDELGRTIAQLFDGEITEGRTEYPLPNALAAGIYFIRAITPAETFTTKCLL